MRAFEKAFHISDTTKIIDLGGLPFNWSFLRSRPRVILANIEGEPGAHGQFETIVYDGTFVPFSDDTFDISYSNSVIEHVGGPEAVLRFAGEIRRLAPSYYVQTPNKWFFIEPHFMCAFFHWFPRPIKRKLLLYLTPWAWISKPTQEYVDWAIDNIRLLSVYDMRALFPDATIVRERFLGMTKSIIAMKLPRDPS